MTRISRIRIVKVIVGYKSFADPVHYRFGHHSRLETIIFANDPRGHDSSCAASCDIELILMSYSFFDERVHSVHHIVVVLPGVVVEKQVGEFLTITSASSRIRIKNDVTCRGVQLHLSRESVAVVQDGPPVVLNHHGVLLRSIIVWRIYDPSLDVPTIYGALVPDLFNFAKCSIFEKSFVQIRKSSVVFTTYDNDISRMLRTGVSIGDEPAV